MGSFVFLHMYLRVRFSMTPGCCSICALSSWNVMIPLLSLSAALNKTSVSLFRSFSPNDRELSSIQDWRTIFNSFRSMASEPTYLLIYLVNHFMDKVLI